jgi:tRNA (uracil-5-)-methyltransferase TRM9
VLETLRNTGAESNEKDIFTTPPAKALIFVWALEQKGSRRGWDEGDSQDVMVPWVMKAKNGDVKIFHRYYHLYRNGELERDISEAGGIVIDSGYEKDNWWAIARRPLLSS